MTWKIPLFKTYWEEDDVEAVSRIIRRGTYWAAGPEIEEFEKKTARFVGTKYAVAFNSGTSALHTLLLACNIKDKEVIVPSFTFIATANSVVLAGGKPIFAESEPETFGLDAGDVEKKITSKTKAILPIHYGGFPARDIEKLRKIAEDHSILLLEDAAESLGATMHNKKVGTFGHSAIFSFCQNKIISTGEGGLLVTDSQEIYEKARLIRSHGRVESGKDYFSSTGDNDYIEVGYNFRMPTMLAALGISQLNKIEKIIRLRRKNAIYLTKHLSHLKVVTIPKENKKYFSVYQMYPILLLNEKIRNSLQEYLAQHEIMSKIYFNPAHLKTVYQRQCKYIEQNLPLTESLSKRILNLPIFPTLKKEEMDYMIKVIKDFFNKK